MKHQRRPGLAWALLGLVLLPPALAQQAVSVAAPPASAPAVESLAWLAGCWARDRAEPGSGEHWMPLAGGTLLGVSRTVRRGVTVGHEFMQVRRLADGAVAFIAQLPGQPETSFLLQPGPPRVAVFENPQHDFPQRVIYRQIDDQHLQARIEGRRNGAVAAVDFAFTRSACDVLPPSPAPLQAPVNAGETGKP